MSAPRFSVARLDDVETRGPWVQIRRHFGIEAFGVNAWIGREEGAEVISEHSETTTGHEELYVVVAGRATFTVDDEEVDAPSGTLVFVRDPEVRRRAVAREEGTTVLAVGGKPGEAYRPLAWEYSSEAFPLFEQGEYQEAYDILAQALEEHPDAGGILYNLACAEARLGRTEDALAHLRQAIEVDERFGEYARTDPDFDAIRAEAGFPSS